MAHDGQTPPQAEACLPDLLALTKAALGPVDAILTRADIGARQVAAAKLVHKGVDPDLKTGHAVWLPVV